MHIPLKSTAALKDNWQKTKKVKTVASNIRTNERQSAAMTHVVS